MPDSRPLHTQYGTYDDPPSTETSTPRTRREGLHRAIRNTSFLAREANGSNMSDQDRRPRSTLLSPINRRRYRSPSNTWESPRDTPDISDSAQGQRSKRRKLDGEDSAAATTPIKYGHFGQVEPGTLKLDLISCDGGEHVDPRNHGLYLGVKNVLQHNKSVYCSERPSANIILKHADDTVFDLEKLHIVGPEHGFTAPVREGLVYVAMTLHDLQKYLEPPPHARRATQRYPSPRRHRRYMNTLRQSPERLTLSDALRDPHIDAALGRRSTDYARAADSAHDLVSAEDSYYGSDFGFGREDAEAHCEIPALDHDTSTEQHSGPIRGSEDDSPPPVTVLSDEDAGPEETTSQEVIDFRLHRLRLMRRRHELELLDREEERWTAGFPPPPPPPQARRDDPRDGDENEAGAGRRDGEGMPALRARARVLWNRHIAGQYLFGDPPAARDTAPSNTANGNDTASTTTATPQINPSTQATNRPAEPKDPTVTCAHFSIKPGKHKVAIHFDPGISGRFILVKAWGGAGPGPEGCTSSVGNGSGGGGGGRSKNVDVQSIIAKGYGGCRFFPAREVR